MKKNSSYNQIIKSTTIFGGSQVFIILIGIIRTKIIAVLLGPVGIGIIGIYNSIIDMLRSVSGMGIDTAGVKEIAEVHNENDKELLNKTINRYNIWFRSAALFGSLVCLLFCYPITVWAFEDGEYTLYTALLSICVFLAILATGRSTILQGMRQISDLAKSNILASFTGLIITTPIYYFFGVKGIIPAFILTYLAIFLSAHFYYKKIAIKKIYIPYKEVFRSGVKTLKLGIYIVVGGFISTCCMFIIRGIITRDLGIDSTGYFQAAWTITNVYLGLILRSMGSDFFPRLSAISNDKNETKKLINEQTYIVLIIASPVIIAMLLLSDFALSVLYSSEFTHADSILRWQIIGTFLKVLSWPIAFLLLAKNKGLIYLITEFVFFAVYFGISYLLFPHYGLDAWGVGFFIAYLIYLPMIFLIGKNISDFGWTKEIVLMTLISSILIAATFILTEYYAGTHIIIGGVILISVSFLYSYLKLKKVFSLNDLKDWFRKNNR